MLPLLFGAAMAAPTVSLELTTDVPLQIAVRGTIEGPLRLRWVPSVGLMPSPYLDLVNRTAVSQGWYDQVTADLIEAGLHDALIVRNHLGWRPFPDKGFHVELGHGVALLGGGLTTAETVEAASGATPPVGMERQTEVSAGSTVHQLDVGIGWTWSLAEHLILRADLGGLFSLSANSDLAAERPMGEWTGPFLDVGAAYLDGEITSWVHTPTLGLGVGWRF